MYDESRTCSLRQLLDVLVLLDVQDEFHAVSATCAPRLKQVLVVPARVEHVTVAVVRVEEALEVAAKRGTVRGIVKYTGVQ